MATIYEKMTAIGNAIRTKTGGTDLLSLDEMASEIKNIKTGEELNFSIIGNTSQPINPIDNTIWINTDHTINKWTFAAEGDAPTSPIDGDIWIITVEKGNISFNTIKSDNKIIISIYKCKQYISSAWVDKEMKCYQNGTWLIGIGYLYKDGVISSEWGGFTNRNYHYSDTSNTSFSITDNGTNMYFSSPMAGRSSAATSTNQIDLTNKSHIYFKALFNATDSAANRCHVGICNTTSGVCLPMTQYTSAGTGSVKTHIIDVSGYTGKYYVGFGGHNYRKLNFTIYEIWYD